VDASAVVRALVNKDAVGIAAYELITEATCHAPYLLDAEVGHALRRIERAGQITSETALTALVGLPNFVENRYGVNSPLARLAWQSRHTITFYDGLYVALAMKLGVPLLTADVKLSKAPGLSCTVELIK
jgi:predicted nucleic acid-binding protein